MVSIITFSYLTLGLVSFVFVIAFNGAMTPGDRRCKRKNLPTELYRIQLYTPADLPSRRGDLCLTRIALLLLFPDEFAIIL